jgi:hypothetical protein
MRTLERTSALQGKGFALDAVSPAFAALQARRTPSASRPSAAEAPAFPSGRIEALTGRPPKRKGHPMSETKLTRAELAQFTGSEQWHRHGLVRSMLFTDGAKYVADKAGGHWLLDEIALAQRFEKSVAAEEFQLWKLTLKPDHTAVLACEDGNGKVVLTKAFRSRTSRWTRSSFTSPTGRFCSRVSIDPPGVAARRPLVTRSAWSVFSFLMAVFSSASSAARRYSAENTYSTPIAACVAPLVAAPEDARPSRVR